VLVAKFAAGVIHTGFLEKILNDPTVIFRGLGEDNS